MVLEKSQNLKGLNGPQGLGVSECPRKISPGLDRYNRFRSLSELKNSSPKALNTSCDSDLVYFTAHSSLPEVNYSVNKKHWWLQADPSGCQPSPVPSLSSAGSMLSP